MSRFGCTSKMKKVFLETKFCHFFRTFEASNRLSLNVGLLIFKPRIVRIALPYGIKTIDIIAFMLE